MTCSLPQCEEFLCDLKAINDALKRRAGEMSPTRLGPRCASTRSLTARSRRTRSGRSRVDREGALLELVGEGAVPVRLWRL